MTSDSWRPCGSISECSFSHQSGEKWNAGRSGVWPPGSWLMFFAPNWVTPLPVDSWKKMVCQGDPSSGISWNVLSFKCEKESLGFLGELEKHHQTSSFPWRSFGEVTLPVLSFGGVAQASSSPGTGVLLVLSGPTGVRETQMMQGNVDS